MNLSARLTRDFSTTTRSRGRNYYRSGMVRIEDGSDSSVIAHVRGSRVYKVSLDLDADGTLFVECDCPYFDREGECKHIWATILAAESQGYLSRAAYASDLWVQEVDDNPDEEVGDFEVDLISGEIKLLASKPQVPTAAPPPKPPAWRKQLTEITGSAAKQISDRDFWPAKRQILYLIDVSRDQSAPDLVISLESRDRKQDGNWGRSKPLTLKHDQIPHLPVTDDREILAMLIGGRQYWGYSSSYETIPSPCHIKYPLAVRLMPLLAGTGRCYLRRDSSGTDPGTPLAWDGEPWQLELQMQRSTGGWAVIGALRRQDQQMELSVPVRLVQGGLIFTKDCVAPLAEGTPFEWISFLRQGGHIEAPESDKDELLATLLCSPDLPPLTVPEELRYEEVKIVPRPRLRVRAADPSYAPGVLRAELSFDYEGRIIAEHEPSRGWYEGDKRHFVPRDVQGENAAASFLFEAGVKLQT